MFLAEAVYCKRRLREKLLAMDHGSAHTSAVAASSAGSVLGIVDLAAPDRFLVLMETAKVAAVVVAVGWQHTWIAGVNSWYAIKVINLVDVL